MSLLNLKLILCYSEQIHHQFFQSFSSSSSVSVLTALERIENVTDKGFERFLLMHDGSLYIFTYQDTVEKFDTKESQDTLNHIINSIRFLNPEQNGDIENEDQNETDEDDDDN